MNMFTLIKEVFAAFCSIILELCRGTEAVAKSYSEVTGTMHDYAKTLRPSEEQLEADNQIASIQRDVQLVTELNKLRAKCGTSNPDMLDKIDKRIEAIKKAIEDANKK